MTALTKKQNFNIYTFNFNEMLKTAIEDKGTISECYSLFHEYSLYNQFLAIIQLKMQGLKITPLNCGSKWIKAGRKIKVNKSNAIWLCLPIYREYWKENEETGKKEKIKVLSHFKYCPNWYSLEQTEGKEFNAKTCTITDFDFDKVYKKYNIEIVDFEELNGNIQGYAKVKNNKLAINPIAEHPEMTILHEVAHIAFKHDKVTYGSRLKEVEAEAVAYIVGAILKFSDEQLSSSRGYIQSWLGDGCELPKENAENIFRIAKDILNAGCTKKIELQK